LQLVLDRNVERSVRGNVEAGLTGVPLLQINPLPVLTQVNVLFPTTDLLPTLVHLAPAFVAECAGSEKIKIKIDKIDMNPITRLFISWAY
jgi:hypothetical protein